MIGFSAAIPSEALSEKRSRGPPAQTNSKAHALAMAMATPARLNFTVEEWIERPTAAANDTAKLIHRCPLRWRRAVAHRPRRSRSHGRVHRVAPVIVQQLTFWRQRAFHAQR